ncbi:hypothetical protein DZF98_07270 [Clavibacter californiensis]|uniref:Uncharacterized protein n=1 Tax=Clavibacter californiensis TaxID=1401995 RepID=A0ABX9N629_9MICO|nr:hypothetical protein DZF98_07270 [Clavibacter californiensis]
MRGALALTAAAIVVAIVLCVDPEPAPVMLGIALVSSLSRSQSERDFRGCLEALALLPVLAVLTSGIGALLRQALWLGAALYVAALVAATLVRRFGELGRRLSTVAATPSLAVLFLPAGAGADHGPVLAIAEPILVAVLAWTVVTLVQASARRLRVVPSPGAVASGAPAPRNPAPDRARRPPHGRRRRPGWRCSWPRLSPRRSS